MLKVYASSSSPYYFSLLLVDSKDRDRIKFVNNENYADFLVTNHHYLKGDPILINKELKKKFKLLKEFKVNNMAINSIFKVSY